ncbi:M50 family metallopeptidase [Mycobacterium sp. TY814]|uniref:M50 family metallopeptidase n=1 Tax=Mycobacterium sp. TY814 TaxID=3050580 RepID=UPI0027408FB6|nr:M50 family metallopeptidase [Mycobacterium sp. TY814]MDP7720766.1 M50 family metallopeptidase [Mycobacterium sp. TY814]
MPLTLADITAGEREHLETCIHEAGHAVAGVVLGAELRNAVVVSSKVTGTTEGLTTFADRPHGTDPLVAYAGPWAQARWRAGRRPTQREFYAVLDTTGHKDSRVLTASGGIYTGADVVPLLTWCWPAVARTATHLHRTGEVDQRAVLAALGVTDGGGMTSVQLAGIRSRCRTVPPIAA